MKITEFDTLFTSRVVFDDEKFFFRVQYPQPNPGVLWYTPTSDGFVISSPEEQIGLESAFQAQTSTLQ